ncbi:MAG: hypothetical protein HQ518_03650 [Rhodopirellula sp.]|nr:hypothetical protein [Rhodopirellula sp.]
MEVNSVRQDHLSDLLRVPAILILGDSLRWLHHSPHGKDITPVNWTQVR